MSNQIEMATDIRNLTRQKLSALIRRTGVPASKSSKGRVSWRTSDGYDLMLWRYYTLRTHRFGGVL